MTHCHRIHRPRAAATSFALVLALFAGTASAGARFDIECKGPSGTFATTVSFGGGFLTGEVTGWCQSRQALVHETWKTSWKVGTPKPREPRRERVFDPRSGSTIELVHVKDCREPVIPIGSEEELRRIPPCAGATVTINNLIEYD
jgi:hypothetical protein